MDCSNLVLVEINFELQVTKNEAISTSKPTPCQFTLQWKGKGSPEHVEQRVILDGSKGSKWFWIDYQPQPSASRYNSTEQIFVMFNPSACDKGNHVIILMRVA